MRQEEAHLFSLPSRWQSRFEQLGASVPQRYVYYQEPRSLLRLVVGGRSLYNFPCSRARNGMGAVSGSEQTPPGIHRIDSLIGHGVPLGTEFVGRTPTGNIWQPGNTSTSNRILSRIVWLRGVEPGINQGGGVDSYNRYIYIHGTDKEHLIGTPISHGCLLLKNNDIIELFAHLHEEMYVIISPE